MVLLIIGILIWVFAHLFKRMAPDLRESMGNNAKGIVAFLLLFSVALMVTGYRTAEFDPIYTPFPGMGHLNNLLMLISIFLFGVGGTKGMLYPKMRHPMLWGTVIWGAAHLLVNGDLASVVLFGSMIVWAFVEMLVISRKPWERPTEGRGFTGDLMNLAGTAILFALIACIHIWLDHNPFLGTYG